MKGQILGTAEDESEMVSFLGRTLTIVREGIEYEGDTKHAEILVEEWEMQDAKAVVSPSTAEEKLGSVSDEMMQEIPPVEATRFRRAAARINYMALDRADLGFAAKDVSRAMSSPTRGDEVKLKLNWY